MLNGRMELHRLFEKMIILAKYQVGGDIVRHAKSGLLMFTSRD